MKMQIGFFHLDYENYFAYVGTMAVVEFRIGDMTLLLPLLLIVELILIFNEISFAIFFMFTAWLEA